MVRVGSDCEDSGHSAVATMIEKGVWLYVERPQGGGDDDDGCDDDYDDHDRGGEVGCVSCSNRAVVKVIKAGLSGKVVGWEPQGWWSENGCLTMMIAMEGAE